MKTIAIVTGGNSSEFDISVKSARAVERSLRNRYDTYLIMIKGLDWYWEDSSGQIFKVDKNTTTRRPCQQFGKPFILAVPQITAPFFVETGRALGY